MFKKLAKYLILSLIAIFGFLLEFSFFSVWPLPWSALNISLILIISGFILFDYFEVFFLSIVLGFLNDIFNFHHFSFNLIAFFLTSLVIYLILKNIITNRSLYSFLFLSLIALIVNKLLFILFSWIFNLKIAFSFNFLELFSELLINLLVVLIIFNLLSFASRRLQPFFLRDS